MTDEKRYILDSDVLITAKNAYYAFDICPGFWDGLLQEYDKDRVLSIDRVRNEILKGGPNEDLVTWVREKVPKKFFCETTEKSVVTAYSEIMIWSQSNKRYFDVAKSKFATGADGWLVAYAKINDLVLVTNEISAPDSKSQIKLPDVCNEFDVKHMHTFTFLRTVGLSFNLAGA